MLDFQRHQDWPAVKEVCQTLQKSGYKAWLAGGCVRDALLGRLANDFDVVTDARPEDIEKIFEKTLAVGKSFGVVVVVHLGLPIEVATFRSDGNYSDGRHPDKIEYAGPEEDAQRRDFTVNALYFDLENKVIVDYVDGQKDLQAQTLRTVGSAPCRFGEDRLRMLRAVRFAAQLDFILESETFQTLQAQHDQLLPLSAERLQQEWEKILLSQKPAYGLSLLFETGLAKPLLGPLWPLFFRCDNLGVSRWNWVQTLFSAKWSGVFVEDMWTLMWWPLVEASDLSIKEVEGFLKNLRHSTEQWAAVTYMLLTLNRINRGDEQDLPELVEALAHNKAPFLITVVDLLAKLHESEFPLWQRARVLAKSIMRENGQLPPPLLSGHEVKAMGWTGVHLGRQMRALRRHQLIGELPDPESARQWLLSLKP